MYCLPSLAQHLRPMLRQAQGLGALLLAGLLSAACGTTVPTQEPVHLRLAASSSALPLAGDLADAYHAAYPHITVDVLPLANEAAAAQAVLAGRADAALAAWPGSPPEGLAASLVASDAVAVVVHRDRPLDDLTSEQVQEILRGRLRTWDEVDAGEGPIQVVTREEGAGPRLALVEALLGRHQLTPTAVVLPDDRQVLERVARDRDALGGLPAAWLDPRVKAVTLDGRGPEWVARQWPGYPVALPIHLFTSDAPPAEAAALRDYLLSPRGQRMVSRRYAPVPAPS